MFLLMYFFKYTYMYIHVTIWMYVYVCIHMYTYVYVCIRMYSYVYVCIRMYTYVYVCIRMYTYVFTYTYRTIYAYTYMCIGTYIHVYTCIYIYIYTHIHTYINIHTHIYTYIYTHARTALTNTNRNFVLERHFWHYCTRSSQHYWRESFAWRGYTLCVVCKKNWISSPVEELVQLEVSSWGEFGPCRQKRHTQKAVALFNFLQGRCYRPVKHGNFQKKWEYTGMNLYIYM